MPRSDPATRLLAAKKYLQGKAVTKEILALSEVDLAFIMMAFGSGANPKSFHEALKEYATDSKSVHLSREQELAVASSGEAVIQLYSFLRDPVQQGAWSVDSTLRDELHEMEREGNVRGAVTRLEQHLEGTKKMRGGKVAKVVEGTPPKGRQQSALSQLVAAWCNPKQASRAILTTVPIAGQFAAVEGFYKLVGTNKKDVENAARLASAGLLPEHLEAVRAVGVTAERVDKGSKVDEGGVALDVGSLKI